jgi:rhodanese-related sulfurtransferase
MLAEREGRMNSIALPRRRLFFGALLVLCAALMHSGNPAKQASFDTPEVSVPQAIALIDSGALVIDVRERSVSAGSHLPGALLIPLEVVAAHLSKMELAKAQSIVVYCNQGTGRGPAAVQALAEAGFTNVVNLQAGIEGWRGAGMPTTKS